MVLGARRGRNDALRGGTTNYAVVRDWSRRRTCATIDLLSALLPCLVVIGAELFWLGKESVMYLSWRHHIIGLLWALYSVVDFFATNITNQRLRALQFAPPRIS